MNTRLLIATGVIVLIAVIITSVFYFAKQKETSKSSQPNVINNPRALEATQEDIFVSNDGFSPAKITVGVGSRVAWTNISDQKVTVNSDEYPTNALWPFLNLGSFNKDQRVSTVFTKAGTYTYHNQLKPDQRGTIIVK